MISQARSRSLCQGCRNSLQTLFERGFCTTTVSSKTRLYPQRQQTRIAVQTRYFSGTVRSFAASDRSVEEQGKQEDHELSEDDAALASQAALIEQLEKELGIPIEQAIEEDRLTTELITKYRDRLQLTQVEEQDAPSDIDSVASLRDAGASTTDVIREARQIHGDVLPDGVLNDEELILYRRFYGEPAKESVEAAESDQTSSTENRLFTPEGTEISFRPINTDTDVRTQLRDSEDISFEPDTRVEVESTAQSVRSSQNNIEEDEYDDVEEEQYEEEGESSDLERGHYLTTMGRFRTSPKTTFLSQDGFVKPVEKIMSGYSNKHLKEMCERIFGGPGLPDSPLTPRSGRLRKQIAIPLDVNQNTMGDMEANAFVSAVMPPTYASVTSVLAETRKRLGSTWLTNVLAREGGPRVLDAGGGGIGIIAWREIVQAHWESLHSSDKTVPPPPTSKSVVLTGSDGLRHRAAEMLENTTFIPRLPDYVHTRDRPTLDDDRPTQKRKQFDIIIAPHALYGLGEDWMRKQHVQNLWSMLSDEGGVLILIEKGVPRGFEAIAGAREMLLERYIAVPEGQTTRYSKSHAQQLNDQAMYKKDTAMIVAPCTNHERCPMYTAPGLSRGRKDICSFQQRYIRPPFLQRVLGAKDRNHDDVDFSYLSVMKGDDLRLRQITTWGHVSDPISAPLHPNQTELNHIRESLIEESREGFEHLTPETNEDISEDDPTTSDLPIFNQMPRIVSPPIKRRGHVTIDLCTSTGQIERWTIPRSFSKQAYRDARKSKWGDIWALGAKTHVARNLKLGSPDKELIGKDGEIIRKGRGSKERLKMKAMQKLEEREEQEMEDLMEERDLLAAFDEGLASDDEILDDTIPSSEVDAVLGRKPMNNRERKAARKALRDEAYSGNDAVQQTRHSISSSNSAQDDADSISRPHTQSQPADDGMDDVALDRAMAEWQADFDQVAKSSKSGRRGKGSPSNSASQAAKKWERYKHRT